jgi:adenylosuccinate lyase
MDDSANRRVILPEAFLAADEMVQTCTAVLTGLRVNQRGIAQNLEQYGPFAATEQILMVACRAGADRQQIHQVLREYALRAWSDVQDGRENPLENLLVRDPVLLEFVNRKKIRKAIRQSAYLGDAVYKAKKLAAEIREAIGD